MVIIVNETILMAISKWAMKNFSVSESLTRVGKEILQKHIWIPLRQKIAGFFSSDKEAEDFVEKISSRSVVNQQKPERDVEDVYEEMKGCMPDKELFKTVAEFFADHQELLKEINKINNGDWNNHFHIQHVEKFVNAGSIETLHMD